MRQKNCGALTATAVLLALTASAVHAQAGAAPPPPPPPAVPSVTPGTAPSAAGAPPVAITPATPVVVPVPPAPAPPHRKPKFRIGPAVGVYLPSSSKTRAAFGDTWVSIGIGLGSINPVSTKGTLALDLNILYHDRDGNHVFFAPLGLGYRIALTPGRNVIPYVGVSADVDFSDITSNPANIHNSFEVGGGGSAFIGVNFTDRAFIEARYYGLSSVNGYDLSGLNIDAGYRF
jgi:hypothetical protein